MTIYLVTSRATERHPTGEAVWSKVMVHGLFTSKEHADALADKYGGTATPLVRDREMPGLAIEPLNLVTPL